ncbi:exo-alpha-sialidase [Nocardioides sp. DS6]|uniref:exo-alpha-sialidase n=1 Tax=Nocardioides eburneus TaxID=3231482 RepID=A0ABV3SWQ9_9ACTN
MQRPSPFAVAAIAAAALLLVTSPALAAAPHRATSDRTRSPHHASGSVDATGLRKTDLATSGVGSPVYRIAALTVTNRGTLIAAYDARPGMSDLPSNISDVIRRSTDGGRTWTDQQVVQADPAPKGYGDPSLLVDRRTGRIFDFYAAGVNQGFAGSHTGNDPDDPDVLQADYSYSDDDGLTWHHRRITPQIKDPSWGGMFAASGQGIQLSTGPYAGRLVQQYVVRINGANYAASAYSDDDGGTWHMGTPVGPGADENKTVQLANGDVLLDSRATPYRLTALSHDGGQTYSTLTPNADLVDPGDNGSIIRYAPHANPRSPQAHWLLESNNANPSSRENLVVKMSCDDGRTWPVTKVVEPGAAAYSTLTNLPDGRFGLLYERGDYEHITYTSFGRDWLRPACASIASATTAPVVLRSGGGQSLAVTVTNTGDRTQPAGVLRLTPGPGVTGGRARLAPLAPGASRTVRLPVAVAADAAAGPRDLTVTFHQSRGISQGTVPVTLQTGTTVWSTPGPVTADGVHATDESAALPALASLADGMVAVRFRTTQTTPAGVLVSAADPASTVKDLILSVNAGAAYAEIRTATSAYPVRIATGVRVDDGAEHLMTLSVSPSGTTLGVDGHVVGTSSAQAFFNSVSGLGNLTLGANVAANGTRWQFAGTIESVTVTH